jgi:UDP-N-acetylglucosamine 2-epimerase
MPEEYNRILTDNLSDYLFTPTRNAVKNLKNEKIRGKVYYTGDLSVEIIDTTRSISKNSEILDVLNLKSKSYLLLQCTEPKIQAQGDFFIQLLETFEVLKDNI